MAEAVGFAASITGMLGLSGQIIQGSLFIREFFDDLHNAPTEVCDLKDEIELFTVVASDTEIIVKNVEDYVTAQSLDNLSKTLRRCRDIVVHIGHELNECAGNRVGGKLNWWKRLRVATRKKTLAAYIERLDRAKGQLLAVHANVTQTLLIDQQKPIRDSRAVVNHIRGVVLATTTIVGDAKDLVKRLEGTVETMNQSLHKRLTEINDNIHNVQSAIKLTAGSAFVSEDELAMIVEALRDSHVRNAAQAVPQSFQHNDALPSKEPSAGLSKQWKDNRLNRLRNTLSGNVKRRRISHRKLDFWIVSVEIENCETYQIKENMDFRSFDPALQTHLRRKYVQARLRIPVLNRKVTLEYQWAPVSYLDKLDVVLRTSHLVSRDSPIFDACYNHDLPSLQLLFEMKAASPMDCFPCPPDEAAQRRYFHEPAPDLSLMDIAFKRLFSCRTDSELKQAITFIKYLLQFYSNAPEMLDRWYFNKTLYRLHRNASAVSSYLGVIREILSHTKENPFDVQNAMGFFIGAKGQQTPISKFLLQQSYHTVDIGCDQDGVCKETDRQMLADPGGNNFKDSVRNGCQFAVLGLVDLYDRDHTMHALVEAAHLTMDPQVETCCRNRLAFLIQEGWDVNILELVELHPIRISVIEYAVRLGLHSFISDTLRQAGWSRVDVNDRLDEVVYRGIPGLFDASTEYKTQKECRKGFVLDLLHGKFRKISKSELEELSSEIGSNIGTYSDIVTDTILECNSAFEQKLTPGSWDADPHGLIVPGVDFDPLVYDMTLGDTVDMREWLQAGIS